MALGFVAAWPWNRDLLPERTKIPWATWLLLIAIAFTLTLIGRGLGMLDEYQNFPAISIMATGEILNILARAASEITTRDANFISRAG